VKISVIYGYLPVFQIINLGLLIVSLFKIGKLDPKPVKISTVKFELLNGIVNWCLKELKAKGLPFIRFSLREGAETQPTESGASNFIIFLKHL